MEDVFNYFRPATYYKYPIVMKSATGTTIKDVDGKDYLDFFASMGIVSCGHNIPRINQALINQVNTIWASSFFPTEIQLQAISKINSVLPDDLELITLYSTGAEAMEQAIRLARAATGRKRIISFKEHFHGKTHGTMFLHKSFPECYGFAPDSYRTVIDSDGKDDMDKIEKYLESTTGDDLAAVVFEPVIGYSGPRRLHNDFFRTIRRFCDENKVLMIADEILTGFHRCKGWFVTCNDGIKPDILVFGKGVGNGYPVSGVACTDPLSGHIKNALPGSTFAGNSLACAVVCAVIDFMREHSLQDKPGQLEKIFFDFFSQTRFQSHGIKLDGMGGLLSLGFNDIASYDMRDIYLDILREGVITSFTSANLRISPPLMITMNDFERGLEVIGNCICKYSERGARK